MVPSPMNLEDYAVRNSPVNQSSKRLKIGTEDLSQFQPGAIIKLRLENFVTYALTEFHLSPSLNMIIGPNGSGKSTFVCAVCLGLAGKPEYIGRSKKIEDFIKNGEERGLIEITLKRDEADNDEFVSSDHTTKITRILLRSRRRSDYLINDVPVSEHMVKRLISQLNIQLDNLCQFLSQERVEEFARLKSDKLLIETARSVDLDLVKVFEELKQLQEEVISETKEVEIKEKRRQELSATKEQLEASVRAFEEFKRKKIELDKHTKLLPYVRIKDHKAKIKGFKKNYEDKRSQLKSLLSDKKPFNETVKQLESVADVKLNEKRQLESDIKEKKVKFQSVVEKLSQYRDDIKNKRGQMSYYESRTAKIKERIDSTSRQLESERNNLSSISIPSDDEFIEIDKRRSEVSNKMIEAQSEIRDLQASLDSSNYQVHALKSHIQNRVKSLSSTDRIGVLDGKGFKFEQVKNAVLYIRSKPDMKGQVFEPPVMSVFAKDPRIASYLGTCTDFATSISFTMVDSESYRKFSNDILSRFQVNLRELSTGSLSAPISVHELREMGFDGYLVDFLSGNKDVLMMLCQQHRIHAIPVTKKELSSEMMDFLKTPDERGNLKFRRVIAGNYIYDFKRSSYGARQIFSTDFKARPSQFYQGAVLSEERKAEINDEINRLKEDYRTKNAQLQDIMKSIADKKQVIQTDKEEDKRIRNMASKLNAQRVLHSKTEQIVKTLEEKLAKLKRESRKDVSDKIKECEEQVKKLIEKEAKYLSKIVDFIRALQDVEEKAMFSAMEYLEALNNQRSMNEVIGFFNEKEERLRHAYEEAKSAYVASKDTAEYKHWMEVITSYTDQEKKELAELAEGYQNKEIFDLQHILQVVDRLNSEIGMANQDESVLEILRQTERELSLLNNSLPQKLAALEEMKSNMLVKRQFLEPRLDDVVSKISKKFARLFMNVGSAGAVHLEKPTLFSEWRIEIMVKFRDNATLKRLDSHTQSGGERAVSTVLYMIALQEFTSAPFRVVDEINQGMDSRNERIVHKAMVENACVENTSQYILITPKLLTGLYYHEKMRIHCVMAGAWIPNPLEDPQKVHFGQTSSYIF